MSTQPDFLSQKSQTHEGWAKEMHNSWANQLTALIKIRNSAN